MDYKDLCSAHSLGNEPRIRGNILQTVHKSALNLGEDIPRSGNRVPILGEEIPTPENYALNLGQMIPTSGNYPSD